MFVTRACVILISASLISCLKIILERAEVTYINKKYVKSAYINVSRSSRKVEYLVNGEFVTNVAFDDNLTIHMIFLEYLSNRYISTFIEFNSPACKLLKDPMIGIAFANQGFKCPVTAGKYVLKNMIGSADSFSNVIPFDKGLIRYQFNLTDSNEGVAEADVYLTLVNQAKKQKM